MSSRRRGRYLFVVLPLLLIIVAVALIPVTLPKADDITVPDSASHYPIIPLIRGVVLTQQFPASDGEITSIQLLFRTSGQVNPGTIRFDLQANRGGKWVSLVTRTVRQSTLRDNAYYSFDFSPPISVTKSDTLQIALQSNDSPTEGAAVLGTVAWHPPNGYLMSVSDAPQTGTAIFRAIYERQSGHVLPMLGRIWQRATVMLTIRWQIVLALAFCGALAAILFFGRSLPDGEAIEE